MGVGGQGAGMAVAVLLVVCLAFAVPAEARPMDTIIAEAVQAREAGDLERVVVLLKEALAVRPAPEILNNLGRIYEELGQYADAYAAYRQVVDDAGAPGQLRSLDAGRMAALRPKVAKAWLAVSVVPDGARVHVDGRRPTRDAEGEIGLDAGPHLVQVTAPDGKTARAVLGEWPAGRRTTLRLDAQTVYPGDGELRLDAAAASHALSIDGLAVGGDLDGLSGLRLPAGTYGLSGHHADGRRWSASVTVAAGEVVRLADQVPGAGAPSSMATGGSAGGDSAQQLAATGSVEDGSPIGAYAALGLGVSLAGVGGWLLSSASSNRADLEARLGQQDGEGHVVGVDESEAEKINADANQQEQWGTIALAAGLTAIAGGLTWWSMADAAPSAPGARAAVTVSPWGAGVVVQGRF